MNAVTIEEAQAKLPDLIHQLTPGPALDAYGIRRLW